MNRTLSQNLATWLNIFLVVTLLGSLLPPVRLAQAAQGKLGQPVEPLAHGPAGRVTEPVGKPASLFVSAGSEPATFQLDFPVPSAEPGSPALNNDRTTESGAIDGDKGASATPAASTPAGSPGLLFIENVGQYDAGARFMVRGTGGNLYLADDALWFTFLEQLPEDRLARPDRERRLQDQANQPRRGVNLKLSFPGANPRPRLEPFNRLDTKVSYFIGSDPAKWRPDVPVWGGVRYVDFYPGVDLEITGHNGELVQRLVVRQMPASLAPRSGEGWGKGVRLRVEGADAITLNDQAMHVATAVGDFRLPLLQAVAADRRPLSQPLAAPEVDGREITAPFAPASSASLPGALLSTPHLASPLLLGTEAPLSAGVADLIYSLFLGGSDNDYGYAIAVGGTGNVYVTGLTFSSNFTKTIGAFDENFDGSQDVFVSKVKADGTGLDYSTFLGDIGNESGKGIAADSSGNAYVTGSTDSTNFPTTPGAVNDTDPYTGTVDLDVFVTKLNADGTDLIYSTFLGGSAGDGGNGIAVDSSGNAYVTGSTSSFDFPVTGTFGDKNSTDAFVTKVAADGASLVYSNYLGGNYNDYGNGIALDSSGNAYITGYTNSTDFSTSGAFQVARNGYYNDAFVTKVRADGLQLVYSTYLGGGNSDLGLGIAVDSGGNAYVTGYTESTDFPTKPGALYYTDPDLSNTRDVFVTKVEADGTDLVYSTYLGGSIDETANDIAVDSSGNAYVTGYTKSGDFPTTPGAYAEDHSGGGWDAFVTKVATDGTALVYSTYLGGSSSETGIGIAVDSSGDAYVTGYAYAGFPITGGPSHSGNTDAFVAKLALGGSGPLTYSISGTVVDEDNNPITYTTFLVTTAATSTTLTSTTTITPFIDATGRYTLTDYISGPISVITATAQGWEMFPPFLYLPETGQVLDADFVGTKPPDVVPPNLGIKGANWLQFNDDTANTAYNDKGIGWNLEAADTIDIDIAEYVPPLPENEVQRVSGLAQAITNFADPLIGEGVYTIIRLQTPPPPDPALRCDFPWESNFMGVDGLLTEDFTQVLRQELGGQLGSHANLVITAPLPDIQWRIEDNGQIYIVGKSEDTVYVFDSPYYFDGTYDRHNVNKSCDDLSGWMSLLDTEVDSIIKHPAIVNANPKPVQIFILGNEPNHFKDEWNYSGSEYAHLYNCYYQHWIEREELQDEQGDRLYALFAAGPGQIGPCERVVAGFVGDTPQWVDPNNYETGHQNCKGIDAGNSYANTHGYVPFYQEMLTTGVETIEYADGFAIHAYGYDAAGMVFDRDVTKFPPDGWLATAMDQIRTWRANQGYDTAGIDIPVIVTEYNPGAGSGSVNTPANGWEDWFTQTYCWTTNYPEIDGLLYFVDSAEHSRPPDNSSLQWWPVSLQSDPGRRGFWLNVNEQSCSEEQVQSEEFLYASIGDVFILPDRNTSLHSSALQTHPSISGIITGTLGQPENRTVYQVTGDLEIPTGQVLTITANTSLVFDPGYGLNVAGQLIADGNSVRPIRFLSTDTAGWSGIEIQPSSQNSRCLGCYIENIAPNGVGMRIEAPMTLQHSFIRGVPGGTAISTTVPFTVSNIGIDYVGTGIHVSGSITTPHHLSHLTLSRCQQGIVNEGQTLGLDNSILTTCGFGISTALSGTTAISYSLLHANGKDFVTENGAQLITGTGILTASPDFVDFPGDLHLLPGSPAVNAADPQANYSREPGYNGNRADLGTYGNTLEATEEPPLDQMAVTLVPTGSTQRQGQSGQTVTYTFTLKNSGDVTDTYKIKTIGADSYSYFPTSLYRGGYDAPRYVLALAPQQQISMTLWVYIPLDITSQVSDTVSVKAIGRYGISDQIVLTTTILAFQESGGQVVMEAEHFAGSVEREGKSWITQTTLANYSGLGYVSAWPDTDLQVPAIYTSSSELNYTINLTTTGVYTVWLRGYAPNGAGDSLYAALNDQPATILTGFAPREWSWANLNPQGGVATIEVAEPGLHMLHLWQREDGLRLDKILLTTDAQYNPIGDGPPESERN